MASLSLKGIQKIYPNGFHAVKDFNLEIADKEFIIFVGPSGCGKSTTLRMIAGLEDISDGTFKIDGKVMNNVEAKDRDIAMVFQNYALYPHMTVFDNMAFGLKLRKVPKDEIKAKVEEAARILDLEKLLDRKPKALSGGQRQRLTIARALVREPEILILDDSASALDYATDAKLRAALRTLEDKTTTFIVSQRASTIRHADKIIVLDDGEIAGVGTHDELLKDCTVYQEIYYSQYPEQRGGVR